jgi:hypothetical protein
LGGVLEDFQGFGKLFQFAFSLNDGRSCFFIEDIVPELSRGLIRHKMGDWILHGQLIADIGSHQSHSNNFYIPEIGSHSGSA